MFHFDGALRSDVTVTALVNGDIHDYRTFLHALNRIFGYDNRSQFTGNQYGAEYDIHLLDGALQQFAFFYENICGQSLCVTAFAHCQFGRNTRVNDFCTERLCVLGCHRTDISGVCDSTQTFCGGESLQTGNAHTDYHYFCSIHFTYSGEHLRNEACHVVSGHDDTFVTCASGHAGQGVH